MRYLVTGAAGFIGSHVAGALLERGETVVGIDNLNPYYPVALKQARLARFRDSRNFTFHEVDIADRDNLRATLAGIAPRRVIHLAAQAGVRHSLTHPEDYVSANLAGHLNMLEYCRHLEGLEHLVYASSSSIYGGSDRLPFREDDPADRPVSLYAATKRADELMSYSYAHLYGLPSTGLRYFTVYGPWGRPDMAYWLFAEAIMDGRPIELFDEGRGRRDFTFIDDAVAGTLAVATRPPVGNGAPHRVYNLGKGHADQLREMIRLLEETLGRKAEKELLSAQPGDVSLTHADISAIRADHGYEPTTSLEVGIPKFARWFLAWRTGGGRDPT
jgi:UDP-glucuronate 4-epimerase